MYPWTYFVKSDVSRSAPKVACICKLTCLWPCSVLGQVCPTQRSHHWLLHSFCNGAAKRPSTQVSDLFLDLSKLWRHKNLGASASQNVLQGQPLNLEKPIFHNYRTFWRCICLRPTWCGTGVLKETFPFTQLWILHILTVRCKMS